MTKKEEQNKKQKTKKVEKTTPKKKSTTKTTKKETKKAPTIVQEENHYGRTILAAAIICVIFLTGYFLLRNTEDGVADIFNSEKITEDEKKFKKEYESINGTSRNNGETIKKIEVSEKNKMEYTTLSDVNKILEDGSGIIYFGYAADSASRNIVPVLLDVVKEQKVEKVYYVNVRPDDKLENDIRDTYELNDKNKAKQVKEGSPEYKELITLLANELNDYILTTEKGKKVNTGEKRLITPTVVVVKDGEIIGFHEGTVSSNKEENGKFEDLTKDEEKELKNMYQKMIKDYLA